MNALSPLTLFAMLSSVVLPHAEPGPVDAVGRWLHERTLQAASSDDVPGAGYRPAVGGLRVVALAELDAPEEVRQQLRRQHVVLSWAAGDKAYTLTATGDGNVERKARVLQEIAAAITD